LPYVAQLSGGAGVGQKAALAQRNGNARDGDDGEKSHLKAGLEQRARRPDKDGECGGTKGVERVALAREKTSKQKDRRHQQSALHRYAKACEQRVCVGEGESDERGQPVVQAQLSRDPEDETCKQGNVHSRDDEEVEGAGALEADAELVIEAGTVAKEHGVEHSGVLWRETERRRKVAVRV